MKQHSIIITPIPYVKDGADGRWATESNGPPDKTMSHG